MHLRRIKKNDKTSVPQFLDRLKHINMLLAQFPDAAPQDTFNDEEIKQIFYHSMPVQWRTNFINSGQVLRTYMVQQELQTNAHRKKTRDANKRSQNSSKPKIYTKSTFHSSSKSTKRNSTSNSISRDTAKRNKKLSNDDDCPIHGPSHKWGQCHQNQYGDNFRPRRTTGSSTSTFANNRSCGSGASHFTGRPTPPSQIQVYHNDVPGRSTASAATNESSRYSQHQEYDYHARSITSWQNNNARGNPYTSEGTFLFVR